MTQWLLILFIIILIFIIEIAIYTNYLLIKALRIYIRKNSEPIDSTPLQGVKKKSKAGMIIVAMFNVLIVILVISIPYIQKKQLIYNTENVIICSSENDVERFTELLDENHMEYKIISGTKVKM